MQQAHKEILRSNRPTLVKDLDLAYVFDSLVERNIFEPDDYEDFLAKGQTRRGTNQLFLTALERRGPNAFDAFIASLRDNMQGPLADMLDPASRSTHRMATDMRVGRAMVHPTDATTGPEGDAKPEPMEDEPSPFKTIVMSPSEDMEKPVWPANTPALVTGTEMALAPAQPQDASDDENVYQMKSKPRGIAVVINNKHFRSMNTRKGTDIDGINLASVFERLGFNTLVRNDQTAEQMQQIFREISTHNHEAFDCFILAVLSHGIEGAIYGVDERIVKIEHITAYFEGTRCPTLAGKPKVFFFQACRGERFDQGHDAKDSKAVASSEENAAEDSLTVRTEDELARMMLERELAEDAADASNAIRAKLPSQSDMLLAFATVPGFVSWRNSERGSWFVQALSEVLVEKAGKEDLLSMMTMVNNKVASAFESSSGRNKQIPAPVTMLRKKLYFNPGR